MHAGSHEPKSGREARGESERVPVSGAKSRSTFSVVTRHWMATPRTPMRSCRRRQVARMGAQYDASAQRPSEAIRGHQRPSEVIRVHQRSSDAIRCKQGLLACTSPIRCNQMQSVVIRGHQRSSRAPRLHEPNVFERGARCDPKLSLHEIDAGHLLRHCVLHLRASGAIRGHQRHQRPSEAIRSHRRPSEAIRGNQRQSEAIRHLDTWVDLDEVIAPLCVH